MTTHKRVRIGVTCSGAAAFLSTHLPDDKDKDNAAKANNEGT